MRKSRHMMARMSRRAIRQDVVDLAHRFGEVVDDKVVLHRKGLEAHFAEIRDLERVAMRALAKGGVVVVEDGDCLITTYRFNSYDRRFIRREARRS